jgi:hypothetical protein
MHWQHPPDVHQHHAAQLCLTNYNTLCDVLSVLTLYTARTALQHNAVLTAAAALTTAPAEGSLMRLLLGTSC